MGRFSEHYGIACTGAEDWFDAWLDGDTKLFVDPFLIFDDRDQVWRHAHEELVDFFNQAMVFVAQATSKRHPSWVRARGMLQFPEPDEFCLGFGEATVLGAGSGLGLSGLILDSAQIAIERGVDHVEHFEELALFGEGFGADRISDIVCNVLKARFIDYTRAVCDEFGVTRQPVRVRNGGWSRRFYKWQDAVCELPINPFTGHAVLLVPHRFLRVLPTLDADEFWGFMWTNENEQLRNDFGDELRRNMNRGEIIAYAKRRRSRVQQFVRYRKDTGSSSYDIVSDPDFRVRLREGAHAIAQGANTPLLDPKDLCTFATSLIDNFKHSVEQRGSWDLLWVGDEPRKEQQAQRLFDTSAVGICRDRNVDLTRESGTGLGPVDFKLSSGWHGRVHIELKLAGSSSLKRNLRNQLRAYMEADQSQCGYFVVIQQENAHCEAEFMDALTGIGQEASVQLSKPHAVVFVDARRKRSASKL